MRLRTIALAIAALSLAGAAEAQVTSAASAYPFTASPALTASLVALPRPGVIYAMDVVTGATAGFVLVIDGVTVPADGAVTPRFCLPIAANTGLHTNFSANPTFFPLGAVIVFSSGANCLTKTASATAFISAQAALGTPQ